MIKDWKKTQYGYKNKKDRSKITFLKADKDEIFYRWYIEIRGEKLFEEGIDNGFKTKSAALKFAKEYMRKH